MSPYLGVIRQTLEGYQLISQMTRSRVKTTSRSREFLTIRTVRNPVDHEPPDGTFSLDGKVTLPARIPGNQKITSGNVKMPCRNTILAED